MKTTLQTYYIILPEYGIMTLLMLNKRFEKEERYLECQKIFDAIKQFNLDYETDLPTKITKQAAFKLIDQWIEQGLDAENMAKTHCYYFDKVLAELKRNFELN